MKPVIVAFIRLRRHKAKMIFLTLGLTIGVSAVVALETASTSMQEDIARKLDEFGANILIVPKADEVTLSYGGMSVGGISVKASDLPESAVEGIRSIHHSENIRVVAPKAVAPVMLEAKPVLAVGVNFAEEARLKKWWAVSGKLPAGSSTSGEPAIA